MTSAHPLRNSTGSPSTIAVHDWVISAIRSKITDPSGAARRAHRMDSTVGGEA